MGTVTPGICSRRATLRLIAGASIGGGWPAPGRAADTTLVLSRFAVGNVAAMATTVLEGIVEEAAQRAGIKIRYRPLPPLRSIEDANSGAIDGEVARIADAVAAYRNLIAVPTPISRVVLAVYGKTALIASATRDEISAMRIGIVRGHLLTRKYTQGLKTIEAALPVAAFQMLETGRCEAAILDHFEAEPYLRDHPEPPVHRWPRAWASQPAYMVLNRKHAALVPRLDAALQQMRRDGFIERRYAMSLRASGIGAPPPDEPGDRALK